MLFNDNFWRFTTGFLLILLVSLTVIYFVGCVADEAQECLAFLN